MGSRSSSKKRLTSNGSQNTANDKGKAGKKRNDDTGCMRKLSAVFTRFLFALHAGIALWRVSFDYSAHYLYFLCIGLGLLVAEMVFTLVVRQGREYKWFCPSVLFYLMSVVPSLWLIELSQLDKSMALATELGICNKTVVWSSNTTPAMIDNLMLNSTDSNRTRRDVEYWNEFSLLLGNIRKNSRIRRAVSESSGKARKKKRKRNKAKIATATTRATSTEKLVNFSVPNTPNQAESNVSISTQDLNSNNSSARNTQYVRTTESVTHAAATTARKETYAPTTVPHEEEPGKGIENLGDKIQQGITDLEKGTIEIFNKTTKEVTKLVERLSDAVDANTWFLILHQCLLFVLVLGRWLLPKGDITRDQLSQLLLVFIGVGADILEFVTETLDSDGVDETSCSFILHYVIYGVWSWSLLQFTLVLTASKSRKTRVGFESERVMTTNGNGCCAHSLFSSADLWGILVTLFLQDVPFLATRLYILIVHNLKHQMMIFFTGKNALVVILQVYRIIVLKLERKSMKDDSLNEAEMQPLRGTLVQLARKATAVINPEDSEFPEDIRDATFKSQRDGSVVVKVHLEGEETLRKKRKKEKP